MPIVLDHPDAPHRFVDHRRDLVGALLGLKGARTHPAAEVNDWREEQGCGESRCQGQADIQRHQVDENHRHGDKILRDVAETFGERLAKKLEIVGRPRHQSCDGAIVKKGRCLDKETFEESIAQIADCREPKPGGRESGEEGKEVFDHDRQQRHDQDGHPTLTKPHLKRLLRSIGERVECGHHAGCGKIESLPGRQTTAATPGRRSGAPG